MRECNSNLTAVRVTVGGVKLIQTDIRYNKREAYSDSTISSSVNSPQAPTMSTGRKVSSS